MTPSKAIRTYFEADGGRKITLDEVKQLSIDERYELGRMACEALGEPFEVPQPA